MILMEQNEVDFKYRKTKDEICPFVTLGTILKENKNNDCISLHCFINFEDLPSITTELPYSPIFANGKEFTYNDIKSTIKLATWVSRIDYVNGSSVYFVQQGKVSEWPKEILSIATTPSASIRSSKETIVNQN